MKRMLPGMIAAVVLAIGLNVSTVSAAEKQEAKASTQLVTEGEFSKWLVQVLGLARVVSVAPSEQECFAVLLQNGVSPKDGWNATNVVTRATLARVVVQALGWQGEVKDPGNDASWINFLKEKNLDISTIGAAVENLGPISEPLANQAVVVSTDPLGKVHEIRPEDEQQLGADLSTIRRLLLVIEEHGPGPTPPPPKPHKPPHRQPEPTPNFPT